MTIVSVRLEVWWPHRADGCLERPVRSLAVPPGAGRRRRQRPHGGAEGIHLRAIRRNAAQFLPDSPLDWGRAVPGGAIHSGLASVCGGGSGDA